MWLTSSSVGRKLIMSISGLFLILFLAFHMSMNLVAIISSEAYNGVCSFLGSNWYAVAGTAVLAAGVFVHFAFAIILTNQNRKARGVQGYEVSQSQPSVELASKNMGILGAVIFAGLLVHLFHFWAHMMLPELAGNEGLLLNDGATTYAATDGAGLIKYQFKQPINVIIYIIWLVALWAHLTHGMWSAMQTLGANNKTWMSRWKMISNIFATVVCFGFMAVVIYGAIA